MAGIYAVKVSGVVSITIWTVFSFFFFFFSFFFGLDIGQCRGLINMRGQSQRERGVGRIKYDTKLKMTKDVR